MSLQYVNADTEVIIPLGASHQSTGVFYSPTVVDIHAGDTVTWKNDDTATHTVSTGTPNLGVDGRMDSGLVSPGSAFSHTFDTVGVYGYYCLMHPWMTGTVNVGTDMPLQEPASLSISTDKSYYYPGDNITITGQASTFVPNGVVTVWVTDLAGNGVASNHVSTETSDKFSTTIIPNNLWVPGQKYVVNAQYGSRSTVATADIMYESRHEILPSWLKQTAGIWATGQMTDKMFAVSIQYLIKQGVVTSPQTYFVVDSNYHIPQWVKNTAGWYSQGMISDGDFENEIQYLMASGTIRVNP